MTLAAQKPAHFPPFSGLPGIIHESTDYSKFGLIRGNRQLDEKKIEKLIKAINSGLNMLPYCPVIVDDRMNIIDGQHRFYASQKLRKPIYYVIAHNLSLGDIARLNSNQEKWKSKDFLDCYYDLGIEDYMVLSGFIEDYGFSITTTVALLETGTVHARGSMERFRTGEFKVKTMDQARSLADAVSDFSFFPQSKSRHFIDAIAELRNKKKYDHVRLVSKSVKHSDRLRPCASKKQYLSMLEDVYNIHNQTREVIY